MKSIFLSMLAIAVLASCSKESGEDLSPPGPQGEKMTVNFSLNTGIETKATGVPGANEDRAIADITVFFVDAAGSIITKKYLQTSDLTDAAGVKSATVETKSTAARMLAICNLKSDLTTTTLNSSTETQLKAVVRSLVDGTNTTQVKGELLMSAEGNLTEKTAVAPYTAKAEVTANFVAAKITLTSVAVGGGAQGTFGATEDFSFDGAFLLNVQTNSYYFPSTGSYVPATQNYVNGVNWVGAWGSDPGYTVVPEFNLDLSAVVTPSATNAGHFYVFENRPTSADKTQNPTTLVLQVDWLKQKTPEERVKKYFNVIFAPGEGGVIEAGKAYNVSITLNGDFRPSDEGGGSGGGGTDTPDEPNVKMDVTVTVTPATWTDAPTDKPF